MSRQGWQREVGARWCYMIELLGVGMAVGIRFEYVRVALRIVVGPIVVWVVAGARQNHVVLEVEEEVGLVVVVVVVVCMGSRVGERKPASRAVSIRPSCFNFQHNCT